MSGPEVCQASNESNQDTDMTVHIDHHGRKRKKHMFKGMVVTLYMNLIVSLNLSIPRSLNSHIGPIQPHMKTPTPRMPLRGYQHQAKPPRCLGPHHRPYVPAQFPVRQMGPSAMEGMAGMAEDDITRKIKVEAPNFDRRLELSTIGSLIWITILPGMKCQEHCRV